MGKADVQDFVRLMLKKSQEKDPIPTKHENKVDPEALRKAEENVKRIKEKIK